MNILLTLWNKIITSNDKKYIDEINSLTDTLLLREMEIIDLKGDILKLKEGTSLPIEEPIIEELIDPNIELEQYWNSKITPTIVKYNYDRAINKPVDVRKFLTEQNDKITTVVGVNNDEKANKALLLVNRKIKYTTAKDKAHKGEYWQFANETWNSKSGDCEDGAILMANIMIASGIPYWRIRVNAGDVKGGGHAYVTYLKEEDNTWYVMDWCYYGDESFSFGMTWKDAKKYFGIWFSFNKKYAFIKSELDR